MGQARVVVGESELARRRAAIDEIFNEDCVFYHTKGGVYNADLRGCEFFGCAASA